MEQLIPTINRLQDVYTTLNKSQKNNIVLPQICVVGSQSCGKTSIMTSIVGRDFLPSGSNVVTRRPLILQLIKTSKKVKASDGKEYNEWGEFLHKPNRVYTDYAEIMQEIEQDTSRIAGQNKGISTLPINLKLHSSHFLDLTLIDLPGLTKIPVGDQTKDIDVKIRQMCLEYISSPQTIILAVHAANTDIATSDALQLAKEVDPEGMRTLAVVTKLDLMDDGTDALDILEGRVVPLRLGYIGVVNRSQQSINDGKSVEAQHALEEQFFLTHQKYATVAERCGIAFLTRTLNRYLMHHIKRSIPNMRRQANKYLNRSKNELRTLGDAPIGDNKAIAIDLIDAFYQRYCDHIEGKVQGRITEELVGGAKLNNIFTEQLQKNISRVQPYATVRPEHITMVVNNASGVKPLLFTPSNAFDQLVTKQLVELENPAIACAEDVYEELRRMIDGCITEKIARFSKFEKRIKDVAQEVLFDALQPTQAFIRDSIECEIAYINTQHPHFKGYNAHVERIVDERVRERLQDIENEQSNTKKPKKMERIPSQPSVQMAATTRDTQIIELMKSMLINYFEIVAVKVSDSIPKIIMHFLVNGSKKNMRQALTDRIYIANDLEALMNEDPETTRRRAVLNERLKVLNATIDILNECDDVAL
ncbi:hypothetical protein PCE1_003293 [Barthelona sp. PCE]